MTQEELLQKNRIILSKYIPEKAIDKVGDYIFEHDFKLIIKGDRKSKWGDFKSHHNNQSYPAITVNKSLNKYAFLITFIHEIAHCKTYKEYGNKAEAHGIEWKKIFQCLMQCFLNTEVFPLDILYVLRNHMQNPAASVNADIKLYKVLSNYDENKNNAALLEYIKDGEHFQYEEQIYKKVTTRRKRIECIHLSTGKIYLFSPVAEVNLME